MNESEAKAALARAIRGSVIGIDAVVLDHQLDFLPALVRRLDADFRRRDTREIVTHRAADGFGHNQADRDGRCRAPRP